ncbi:MAG: flagellar assembly protein FliW [Spirochaeta sp. LUC14_002_19_P3]|nr:MAG: flagellar assembly protein FliW [Spirochaeta sp. LUC14_002_19_P3]
MTAETKAYGTVEVDECQRIRIPAGLYGFEGMEEYLLMDAEQHPFYWLQSLDMKDIAFVLINPMLIRPGYDPCLDPMDFELLGLQGPDDENLLMFTIVTIPEDRDKMTVNLQGPLIINRESREGRQCISLDESLKVRHNILDEIASASATVSC